MVSGRTLQGDALREAVEAVFEHAGQCVSDLYRVLDDHEAIKNMVVLDNFMARWREISHQKRGVFVVAPHMSNFDLVLLGAALHGIKVTALAYGKPTGGYDIQNEIRRKAGTKIILASTPEDEVRVIEALKQGEMVITGIDRPIHKKRHQLHFFGYPAPLPAGHIRMALAANAEMMVVAPYYDAALGKYAITMSEPFDLIRTDNLITELISNAERVLNIVESFIRQHPHQWLMYYPVWPQFLDTVDAL